MSGAPGLARAAGDDWWVTTVKGNALANASFGKPISRATATRLLPEVIDRAHGYNADPSRLLTITEIIVFGSYLDPAADPLGDLDLAISTVRRDTGGSSTSIRCWRTHRPAGATSARSTTGFLACPRAADDLEEPFVRDQHH